jgi:hypothetical protein
VALATNTRRKSITEREGYEELLRVAEADAEQKTERLQSEIEELRASNLRLESAQSRNRAPCVEGIPRTPSVQLSQLLSQHSCDPGISAFFSLCGDGVSIELPSPPLLITTPTNVASQGANIPSTSA